MTWLIYIFNVFNMIFAGLFCPILWRHERLITVFRSGYRLDCGNYRGISVMGTFAKVYDLLILSRLQVWSSTDECQAGARKVRHYTTTQVNII